MSKVCFCRSVAFTASHFYRIKALSHEENLARFGESALAHPHDWRLTVWLEGPLDANGMIVDLLEVDALLKEVAVTPFHDRCINEADPFFQEHQPTNEVLAGYFAHKIQSGLSVKLAKLRIAEAEDLFAEWTP